MPEFGVTVSQFMHRMSALRQNLTGEALLDPGQTKQGGISLAPTDGHGVTSPRTPQQVRGRRSRRSFTI